MHRATFRLEFASPAEARIVHDAVAVEADEGPEGTTMEMSLDGSALAVELTGADVSGLRAAMHSALRLLDAAQRIVQTGQNH